MKASVTVDSAEVDIEVDAEVKPGEPINETSDGYYEPLLDHLFTYHAPDDTQVRQYATIREMAREMAQVIHDSCPASADRTAAIRQLQDTVMTANRAIALGGAGYR
jgi:hypothetical protein